MPSGIYKRKPMIKVGDKYGKLIAIKFHHNDKWSCQYWLFKCDCGNEKVIRINGVKSGVVKSCGCLYKTHGMSYTDTYRSWGSIRDRCLNKKCKAYKWYGGRGIKICKKWQGENGFENFFEDMGKKPKGKSLDRINNNLGYSKENCRWATLIEQANNMRSNHLITFNGKTQTIAQWSREFKTTRWKFINKILLN